MYKAKPKAKKNRAKRQVMSMPQFGLPMCTMKYANALANPFSPGAFGACIPVGNFRPSMKNHARTFVPVVVGQGGVGYVSYSPCLANDKISIWATTLNYAGTVQLPGDTTAFGVSGFKLGTLPFDSTALVESDTPGVRSKVQGRIVSAGIKWRYTGTELNRGGTILAYSDPLHETMEGVSYQVASSYAEASITAPDANHTADYMTVFACNFRELNYPDTTVDSSSTLDELSSLYPFSDQVGTVTDPNVGAPIATVYFTGVVGNTYLVEFLIHTEYEGQLAQSMLTQNNSDEQGTYRVQAAASRAVTEGATGRSSFISRFWNGYRQLVNEARPVMVDVARVIRSGMRAYGAYQNYRRGGNLAIMHGEL